MSNILDLLQGQLSEGLVDQLSQSLGADKQQTNAAANGILSTLMSAIAKNASQPQGAEALNNALERDHDGSFLDNISGFLGGNAQASNPKMVNGAGILKHVLGGKQSGAIDMISKMSGLSGDKTGNMMTMLAPMVLGMLGKQKREQGLDASGIAGMLSGMMGQNQKRQEMGIIGKFLDADGDGSFMDDLAEKGMGFLGNLLKK